MVVVMGLALLVLVSFLAVALPLLFPGFAGTGLQQVEVTPIPPMTETTTCASASVPTLLTLPELTSLRPADVARTPEANLARLRPLYWVHIPKCGSSLANILGHTPGLCPNTPADLVLEQLNETQAGIRKALTSEANCPGSFHPRGNAYGNGLGQEHWGIGDLTEQEIQGHGVIMLRQPEQRLMSGYNHYHHSYPYGKARPPKSFRDYASVVNGCAVRMLTRVGQSVCGGPEPPTAEEVALARRRLRRDFAFVGLTDSWGLSVCLFRAMFGGECRQFELGNVRPGMKRQQAGAAYDSKEFQGFRDRYDAEVWEEAKQIFEENLRIYNITEASCAQSCRPGARGT